MVKKSFLKKLFHPGAKKTTKKTMKKTMKTNSKKPSKRVSRSSKPSRSTHKKAIHTSAHYTSAHKSARRPAQAHRPARSAHTTAHTSVGMHKGAGKRFSKPFVLVVVDGMGIRNEKEGNALAAAKMPFMTKAMERSYAALDAAGTAVGLPQGIPGSCETGHATIAAGRVIPQDLTLINKAIEDGSFFKHPVFLDAIKQLKENPDASVHLVGVLSDAGITSHINHLFALIELGHHHYIPHVYIHAILDGRDSEVNGAKRYLRQLERQIEKIGWGEIATVVGRSYALDTRNKERKEHKAYDLMVMGKGTLIRDPQEAVNLAYRDNLGDEYVKPTIINPNGLIKPGDVVVFFNFKGDASREFVRSFTKGTFRGFKRKETIPMHMICVSDHHEPESKMHCIIAPQKTARTLGEVLEQHKKQQVRIAPEESFAHVTDFFDFTPKAFPHEHRVLVHESGDGDDVKKQLQGIVASARKEFKKRKDFYLINIPYLQEISFGGNFSQTVQVAGEVDGALAAIAKDVERLKGTLLITSDHGNAEYVKDEFGREVPSNTSNPVPLIVLAKGVRLEQRGTLADVAPTLLNMMRINIPKEMTGHSLVRK